MLYVLTSLYNTKPDGNKELYVIIKNTDHTARLFRMQGASHGAVTTVAMKYVQHILENPEGVTRGERDYDGNQSLTEKVSVCVTLLTRRAFKLL